MQKISQHLINQSLFVIEYCVDFNGTDAYMRVKPGCTKEHAACMATKYLKLPYIKHAIQRELDARRKRTLITVDRTLAELQEVAYCDIRLAYNDDGTLKHPKRMPTAIAKAISAIQVDERYEQNENGERVLVGYTKKVAFHGKNDALGKLMKHQGIDGEEKASKPSELKVIVVYPKGYESRTAPIEITHEN